MSSAVPPIITEIAKGVAGWLATHHPKDIEESERPRIHAAVQAQIARVVGVPPDTVHVSLDWYDKGFFIKGIDFDRKDT